MKSLILMGPPGAGKGTQAKNLAEQLNLFHFSTGDVLRATAQKQTLEGEALRSTLAAGLYVSDTLIEQITGATLKEIATNKQYQGVIFDGLPRTVVQAKYLDGWFKERHFNQPQAILFEVDNQELTQRITGRLVCGECKATYNTYTKPPKVEGTCDACGAKALQRRSDDTPEAFAKRLEVYNTETAPVVEYFRQAGRLHILKGIGEAQQIQDQLLEMVKKIA